MLRADASSLTSACAATASVSRSQRRAASPLLLPLSISPPPVTFATAPAHCLAIAAALRASAVCRTGPAPPTVRRPAAASQSHPATDSLRERD